jgi:hypothetical protein
MIKGQAKSHTIITWVISNYELEHFSIETFYWSYLAYQVRAICYAKKFGDENGAYSYMGIPIADKVQGLIEESFRGMKSFWDQWNSFSGVDMETFAWPKEDQPTVKARNPQVQGMSVVASPVCRNSRKL